MRAIGVLVGIFCSISELVGIVVGFQASVGTGLAALLIPPYGIYLGAKTILGF